MCNKDEQGKEWDPFVKELRNIIRNKDDPVEHLPWTEIKANTREAEYDDFCAQLVGYTHVGTESNVRFEIAWQLKRIADALEKYEL